MENLKRLICGWSAQCGRTDTANHFVSGGVSDEERVELHSRRGAYSLWVVTAAKKTSTHLADAKVRIRNTNWQVVFDGLLDGPWLFADLPPGRREIEVSLNGETATRVTTLRRFAIRPGAPA